MLKMEEELVGDRRVEERIRGLSLATICSYKFLSVFHKYFGVSEMEQIAVSRSYTERAAKFYWTLLTKQHDIVYPTLKKALSITNQRRALAILEGKQQQQLDDGDVGFSKREMNARVKSLLHEEKMPSEKCNVLFDLRHPTKLFTGRKVELHVLQEIIQGTSSSSDGHDEVSNIFAVTGPAGIGKTQILQQYIQENAFEFENNCIWLNAGTEKCLSKGFRRLTTENLKLSLKDVDGNDKMIAQVVQEAYHFFEGTSALFIFDNAEPSSSYWLQKYLPQPSAIKTEQVNLSVVLISKKSNWGKEVKVILVGRMRIDDAVELLAKGLNFNGQTNSEIKKLAERLHCFPLALQLAISCIQQQQNLELTGTSGSSTSAVGNYLEEFEQTEAELLSSRSSMQLLDDYSKTAFTSWSLAVQKMKGDREKPISETAMTILSLISYLHPEGIERKLLHDLLPNKNEEEVNLAVELLEKYSLLIEEKPRNILRVHSLVREVTMSLMEAPEEYHQHSQETQNFHFRYLKNHLKNLIPIRLQHYIERTIISQNKISPVAFQQKINDIFVFSNISRSQLTSVVGEGNSEWDWKKALKNRKRFIGLVRDLDYQFICSATSVPVHWIRLSENEAETKEDEEEEPEMTLKNSHGSMENIYKFLSSSSHPIKEEMFLKMSQLDSKPVFILDPAGMGKSYLLANAAKTILKQNSDNDLALFLIGPSLLSYLTDIRVYDKPYAVLRAILDFAVVDEWKRNVMLKADWDQIF